MNLEIQRRSSKRTVLTQEGLQRKHTVVSLKKMLDTAGRGMTFKGIKKAELAMMYWTRLMEIELCKDHLIDVIVNDKDPKGSTRHCLEQNYGVTRPFNKTSFSKSLQAYNVTKRMFEDALRSGVAEGTFSLSSSRYRIKL